MQGMEALMKDLGVNSQEEMMEFMLKNPHHPTVKQINTMFAMLDELDGKSVPYKS